MFSFFKESPLLSLTILILIIVSLVLNSSFLTKIFLFLMIFMIYFYRHPSIKISVDNRTVLSPAFGYVKYISERDDKIHIIIILSPLDVHVQYYPINGTIDRYQYDDTGSFNIIYNLHKSDKNEKVITDIKTDFGTVTVKQIAGFLVRRISNNYQDIGTEIKAGSKLGMIKFGSRVDLIIPKKDFTLLIKENDYVYGPNSRIGFFN